jgi:hypothetical protein
MSKSPYHQGWHFDDAEFETAEAAFDDAFERYQTTPVQIVKLCYPKED